MESNRKYEGVMFYGFTKNFCGKNFYNAPPFRAGKPWGKREFGRLRAIGPDTALA